MATPEWMLGMGAWATPDARFKPAIIIFLASHVQNRGLPRLANGAQPYFEHACAGLGSSRLISNNTSGVICWLALGSLPLVRRSFANSFKT